MKRFSVLKGWLFVLLLFFVMVEGRAQRQMEVLDRGLVAVQVSDGVFLSWRLNGYEWYGYTYNVYRDEVLVNEAPLQVSNLLDAGGTSASRYRIEILKDGVAVEQSQAVEVWEQQYLELVLKPRNTSVYEINDITAADLDGDGSYELIVKRIAKGWNVDNTHYSYFEAYKLDGTFLWEINVGPNILPDVEINIAAFDLDGDGKAEVFLRTSEGTIFGDGSQIGDTDGDGITNYRYSVGTTANMQYMNEGPEFLSLVDGETGAELDRVDFIPRGQSSDWGDGYGHRASKYFFGAPYLDGLQPSLFIGRGIYTKTEMRTYDVVGKKLVPRWSFSSGNSGPYHGQGNHNFTIADVDGDGRDEIVWGSMAVDDDGSPLYSTQLGHGDAMHVGDLDPFREGVEAWRCLENSPDWGTVFHDAGTGEILLHNRTGFDTGRAIAANISDNIKGKAMWGGGTMYGASSRNAIGSGAGPENFRIYWDGDLLEELLDHSGFSTSTGYGTGAIYKYGVSGPVLLASGAISNNYTKGTPGLQADLLGDWREEVVWRTEDNTAIRIYTTVDPTPYRVYALMHDHQYRQAVAWQMCGYNQPPHVSFFLGEGEGKTVPPPPALSNGRLVYQGGAWTQEAQVWKKDGVEAVFADGEHLLFDASAGEDSEVLLEHSVAPSVLSVNSPYSINLNASSGELGGSMLLAKSGKGTFTLSGTHSYTGATEVWAGLLNLEGGLTNSPVMLEFFGRLALSGSLGSDLQMRYGSEFFVGGKDVPGSSEISGTFSMEAGARLVFDLNEEGADFLELNGALNVEQGVVLVINTGGAALAAGTYPLVRLPEAEVILPEEYEVEGLTGIPYELKQEGNVLQLHVKEVRAPQTIYWNGAAGALWNLADAESFRTAESTATYFVDQDEVVFDDTAPAMEVELAETLTPSSVLVNTADTYRFSGVGAIAGSTGLVKSGSGSLFVDNVNAFTGAVVVEGGKLVVSAMPSSTANGALGAPSADPALLTLNGGLLEVTQAGSADRAMTLGAAGGTLVNVGELYWNERIVGGKLTKAGSGKLILGGTNSHDELLIREGTVRLLNETTNPGKKVVFEGGVLESYDNAHSYSTWTWNMEVPEGKTGGIYMDGRGDYTGSLSGAGDLNVYIPFVRTDFRGNWSAFTGRINVFKSGDGGDFRVENSYGYPGALVNLGEGVTLYHLSSGTVKLGALEGKGTLKDNSRWEIGGRNNSTTFEGLIGAGNLYKTGTGTLSLTAANTYGGGTTVAQGRLSVLNATGSATGTGAVIVEDGGSINGTGTIAGSLRIKEGARLFAGYTTTGTSLTVNQGVQMDAGAGLLVRLNRETGVSDCLVVGGTFTAAGDLMVVASGGAYAAGQSYQILNAGSINGQFEQILPASPATGLHWDLSELYSLGILKVSDQAVSVSANEHGGQVLLYPNPVKTELKVEWPGEWTATAPLYLQLYNMVGTKVVEQLQPGTSAEVDVSTLPAGVYLLQLQYESGVYTRKVQIK